MDASPTEKPLIRKTTPTTLSAGPLSPESPTIEGADSLVSTDAPTTRTVRGSTSLASDGASFLRESSVVYPPRGIAENLGFMMSENLGRAIPAEGHHSTLAPNNPRQTIPPLEQNDVSSDEEQNVDGNTQNATNDHTNRATRSITPEERAERRQRREERRRRRAEREQRTEAVQEGDEGTKIDILEFSSLRRLTY